MEFSLYRRMSVIEGEKVLETKRFIKPENIFYLPRKWFSTSILKTHYFKSPFYNGKTMMVKVDVNEDYFKRIFSEGKFLKKEPNGFYGYEFSADNILYARSHKTIDSFYNVGILDLEDFNRHFSSIEVIEDEKYNEYLENIVLGRSFRSLVRDDGIEDELDFYFQTGFDVALYCVNFQTLMPEGIDPIIKVINFDKDLDRLNRKNLDRFYVTLLVRFKKEFMNYAKFNEFSFSLDSNEIVKFVHFIDKVEVVAIDKEKENRRTYIQIQGDNEYVKHEKQGEPEFSRLSFDSFESVTSLLLKKEFKIDDIIYYMPELKKLEGISQVDPRHIDCLKTHIEKTINMSNLVVNYFKNFGMEFDAETLVYLKWSLLFHDLGKPFCECLNITTRYSQFGEKDKYRNIVIEQALDSDIALPIKEVCTLLSASSLMRERKIRSMLKNILGDIKSYYNVSDEEAFNYLNRILKVAFLAKVSHTATLKTRAFGANYSDDLMFFERIEEQLQYLGDYEFKFEFEEYFADIDKAFEDIVVDYYTDKKCTSLEMVRGMLKSDYKDLEVVYNMKLGYHDRIDDNEQYNFDDLICAYFMEDNEFLSRYFNDEIVDASKHGQVHSDRVGILSYLIGKLENLSDEDVEILLLASKYHDIGRKGKFDNKTHSVGSVRMMEKDNVLASSTMHDYVYYLVLAHGFRDEEATDLLRYFDLDYGRALKLLSIFKDADALDRVRYDCEWNDRSILNVKYLRNYESMRLVKFAYMLNSQYKQNKHELSADVKRLLKK